MPDYPSINRTALIVKPLKPYWDWANSIEDGVPREQKNFNSTEMDTTVYLIPDLDPTEVNDHIEAMFPEIFEGELEAWWTNEKDWPKNRTFAMFKEWFDVSVSSLVYDTVEEDLVKE
ncbi:MAG: hypothetical protein A2044_04285 [Candidatus Firestonebacteria bacterium GWA2_43_8]|nr:MAG: hypothetical protein A2044_04285 [Candidatus Firestonebacteria bacterium GWA2_43_8]